MMTNKMHETYKDMRRYNLIVIGTGNAGTAMSLEARQAGWSVAIIEELPFGGTCAVKGCIPKKILLGSRSNRES